MKTIDNYIIYADGWRYDYATRLDEAIRKAERAAEIGRWEITLYEVATKAQWDFKKSEKNA